MGVRAAIGLARGIRKARADELARPGGADRGPDSDVNAARAGDRAVGRRDGAHARDAISSMRAADRDGSLARRRALAGVTALAKCGG